MPARRAACHPGDNFRFGGWRLCREGWPEHRRSVSVSRVRRRRLRRGWLAPAALLPLLLLTCGPSADAGGVLTPPYPGLPTQAVPEGWSATSGWTGTEGNGLSEVTRSQQWIKIPAQAVAAVAMTQQDVHYPADDPQQRSFTQVTDASVYLSSPKGAKDGYGIGLTTTVHTVGFGAIPIQVGVQLEQLRDATDLPVPLQVAGTQTLYTVPQPLARGASSKKSAVVKLTGQVRVRLTSLSVDGVDLGLRDCESAPINLALRGKPVWEDTAGDDGGDSPPLFDPLTGSFEQPPELGSTAWSNWLAARGLATLDGGAVTGDIAIPAFAHCLTTTGEDISPLLTSAVSGPGNPVTVGFASLTGSSGGETRCGTPLPGTTIIGPRGPFLGDPSDCKGAAGPPTFDYPARKG